MGRIAKVALVCWLIYVAYSSSAMARSCGIFSGRVGLFRAAANQGSGCMRRHPRRSWIRPTRCRECARGRHLCCLCHSCGCRSSCENCGDTIQPEAPEAPEAPAEEAPGGDFDGSFPGTATSEFNQELVKSLDKGKIAPQKAITARQRVTVHQAKAKS
jgi:hypothetical protein